jgi:hypothetical protein
MSGEDKAMQPEDVTRLVAERLNAGNAAGVAALYEPQAVLAYPADRPVTGRGAIQAIYQQMADVGVEFAIETPLPTIRFENPSADFNPLSRLHRRPRAGLAPAARWLLAAGHRPPRDPAVIAQPNDHRLESSMPRSLMPFRG